MTMISNNRQKAPEISERATGEEFCVFVIVVHVLQVCTQAIS